ncbi:MAG TPA: hypothetical protein PLW10_18410 [Myxococcota bacterium]|nr:hypothetical protein [Myxococcales bacterium]HPG27613.1 hypothetical protein [Myxococcota bacterium]
MDVVYLLGLLVVALLGHQLARHFAEESEVTTEGALHFDEAAVTLPDVEVELPEPFFVFRRSERGATARPNAAAFTDLMESTLSRVRAELLGPTSEGPTSERRLAAVTD